MNTRLINALKARLTDTWRGRIAKAWTLLRKYGLLVFFLGYIVIAHGTARLLGDTPEPQSPGDGYVTEETTLMLRWHEAQGKSEYRVQVIPSGGSFDTPMTDQVVTGTTQFRVRALSRNQTYRWRVIHQPTGRMSRVSSFSTSPHAMQY